MRADAKKLGRISQSDALSPTRHDVCELIDLLRLLKDMTQSRAVFDSCRYHIDALLRHERKC